MKLLKQFSKDRRDYYIMPHTCYGNTGSKVYIKSCAEHFVYDFETDETYRTHLPNATHYELNGRLYSTRHRWDMDYPVSIFFHDGEEIKTLPKFSAHDRTLYRNDIDEWEMFIRVWSSKREENYIAFQESSDFVNWRDPKRVTIKGLWQNEYPYSFGKFKIGEKFYGVCNIGTFGDVFHSPNFHDEEYRIYPRGYVLNDDSEWEVFEGLNFDWLKTETQQQLFVNVVIKGEVVYITTQESDRKHTAYCNIHEMEDKPVTSRIFELTLDELIR